MDTSEKKETESKEDEKNEDKITTAVFTNKKLTNAVLDLTDQIIIITRCANAEIAFANKHAKILQFIDCVIHIPLVIYAQKLVFTRTYANGFGNLLMTLVEEVIYDDCVELDPRERAVFTFNETNRYVMQNTDLASETFYYYLPEAVMPVDILDITIPEIPEWISEYYANKIIVRECRKYDAIITANTFHIHFINCVIDLTHLSELLKKKSRIGEVAITDCFTFGTATNTCIKNK